MKYESFIFNGLKVMAKVKVFVIASAYADTDGDGRAMIISSPDIHPGSLKITRRIRHFVSIGERIEHSAAKKAEKSIHTHWVS